MASQRDEGIYEDLITRAVEQDLAAMASEGRPFERVKQELDWLDNELARHVGTLLERALQDKRKDVQARARLVERVLEVVRQEAPGVVELSVHAPRPTRDALTWVGPRDPRLGTPRPPDRPQHGLVQPALLFNGANDISLVHELKAEMASADRIDAVVAFLKKSGLNLIRPALAEFFRRGGELRLIATTYIGATQKRAVDELVDLGGRIRIAYEEDRTRLHAKAWMFHRHSGLCTAYVGSSNLSRAAMTDGAEWNVRVTRRRTPAVIERFEQAFEQLWNSAATDYQPQQHGDRLQLSLQRSGSDGVDADRLSELLLKLEFSPKEHQREVLDQLAAERDHGHRQNLVVSATGTGKTWVSAFDYERLRRAGEVDTLLFVAHRKEILRQSRDVFRAVLKDPTFGELMVDGHRPNQSRHVFASIQSLKQDAVRALDREAVDMLIVDEFHHAAAPSYQTLLEHLRPAITLGLTATPERMDGKDVLHWFEGRIAAEIRLWDALDAQLLCPFHYFGVHDPTSAERAWRRGQIHRGELDNLYTGDHARARRVVEAVGRYVTEPGAMRALGFCVGIGHAELMASVFEDHGLRAIALHSQSSRQVRRSAVQRLRSGELQAIFTVDLFNEGVDVPEVDTVLFLRPTESATVFLQQLGRGLRTTRHKDVLTVLDFVGHVHQDYRYDVRYRALVGGTLKEIQEQVRRGFPRLPSGTNIELEPAAREIVLASVRRFVGAGGYRRLVDDLRNLPATTTLGDFLARADQQLTDVFIPSRRRSWSDLRRRAGHETAPEQEGEPLLRARVGRLLHVDDPCRLDHWTRWLKRASPPRLSALPEEEAALLRMLLVAVGERSRPVAEHQQELERIWSYPAIRRELVELLQTLQDKQRHTVKPLHMAASLPFSLHATYSRHEVVAGLNEVARGKLREHREGPLWSEQHRVDVFFVTLEKAEDAFKPSVRYADYPISATRFHWESQNKTHDQTPVGKRYVHHAQRGSEVLFFIRERARDARGETLPFVCVGPATYASHTGARPMRIEWDLHAPLPPHLLKVGLAVAG